jgi:hypothetical protein
MFFDDLDGAMTAEAAERVGAPCVPCEALGLTAAEAKDMEVQSRRRESERERKRRQRETDTELNLPQYIQCVRCDR